MLELTKEEIGLVHGGQCDSILRDYCELKAWADAACLNPEVPGEICAAAAAKAAITLEHWRQKCGGKKGEGKEPPC